MWIGLEGIVLVWKIVEFRVVRIIWVGILLLVGGKLKKYCIKFLKWLIWEYKEC